MSVGWKAFKVEIVEGSFGAGGLNKSEFESTDDYDSKLSRNSALKNNEMCEPGNVWL